MKLSLNILISDEVIFINPKFGFIITAWYALQNHLVDKKNFNDVIVLFLDVNFSG